MLTSLSIPSVMDTSTHNLIEDLFVPALRESISYDRGVGFFSSGWLRIAAKGMSSLAKNGGRARWITSPILSKSDWEALQEGQVAQRDNLLYSILARNVDDLEHELEANTLSALAWMIADGILDFRLAVPTGALDGDFHDKFGVFTDVLGNQVSFSGSYNESIQGTRNYESLKVFCSWQQDLVPFVDADAKRFERLWNNNDPNVRVYTLPDAIRARIVQLRASGRPYPAPNEAPPVMLDTNRPRQRTDRVLRDYQEEAIAAWFDNQCRGFIEMATGTGKTITALAASVRLFEKQERLAVIVAVPFQHLVDQWHDESSGFGYKPVLAYASRNTWLNTLNQQIVEYNNRDRSFMSVITTHSTFIGEAFQQSIARLKGPVLLIADEAHHLGASRSRGQLPEWIMYRLALSATPDRWFDDLGTKALRDYFGNTVFSFPLEKAIGVSLTPYYYYPHLVQLTHEEVDKYQELSSKIAKLWNHKEDDAQEQLTMLLIKRAKLLNNAENKSVCLSELVAKEPYLQHTLFYCTPEQKEPLVHLLGQEKGLLVHTFTANEDMKERRQLLEQFSAGDLQGLIAIKCLDEGVDVPATRTAYILASSSNPREFIQRRGRILRMYPGKEVAIIHDLIAVPPLSSGDENSVEYSVEKSIVRRELQRFMEFASSARNKHSALEVIWPLADHYNLMHI